VTNDAYLIGSGGVANIEPCRKMLEGYLQAGLAPAPTHNTTTFLFAAIYPFLCFSTPLEELIHPNY
jgi:hypothetical protein